MRKITYGNHIHVYLDVPYYVYRYQGMISFKIQHTWEAMYSLATDCPFDLASFLRYLKR